MEVLSRETDFFTPIGAMPDTGAGYPLRDKESALPNNPVLANETKASQKSYRSEECCGHSDALDDLE